MITRSERDTGGHASPSANFERDSQGSLGWSGLNNHEWYHIYANRTDAFRGRLELSEPRRSRPAEKACVQSQIAEGKTYGTYDDGEDPKDTTPAEFRVYHHTTHSRPAKSNLRSGAALNIRGQGGTNGDGRIHCKTNDPISRSETVQSWLPRCNKRECLLVRQ